MYLTSIYINMPKSGYFNMPKSANFYMPKSGNFKFFLVNFNNLNVLGKVQKLSFSKKMYQRFQEVTSSVYTGLVATNRKTGIKMKSCLYKLSGIGCENLRQFLLKWANVNQYARMLKIMAYSNFIYIVIGFQRISSIRISII